MSENVELVRISHILLRLPMDLRVEVDALADQQDRSLNKQLVSLIRKGIAVERATHARDTQAGTLAGVV